MITKIILRFAILFFIGIMTCPMAKACTSAVISGRATRSGRPLLWKHRDTGSTEWNHIEHLKGKRFAYTGLVNSDDKTRKEVWAGANERGFAIMNTASYNMKPDSLKYLPEREGEIMKQALGECANVTEFEEFLKKMPQPRALETNFGVIDAEGNAAYFEVWDYGYTKYDVNDSIQAPNGYIIRSNYSFSGVQDDGKGYIRYQNAEYLIHRAYATGELSAEWIFSSASRSFFNAMLGEDLLSGITPKKWAVDQDYIPRYSSSASIVIEGVASGESVDATTIYSVLGYPPCSYAVAAWVKAGSDIAGVIAGQEKGRSSANRLSVTLKHNVFPIKRGNGKHYMRIDLIARSIAALRPYEQKFIRAAGATRDRIAKEGFKKEFVSEYNQYIASSVPNIEEIVNKVIVGK
ncbi:MAG: hypothetical protein E7148_06780 [Rikenellaceae bacterium]|nr:hypothetical protein [Rikenellaceae bacterium]